MPKRLTLWCLSLAATTANTDAEDGVALLGLVAQSAGLLRASGTRTAGDNVDLSVLPGADTQKEAHHIGLLVAPDLLHILVGSHVDGLLIENFSKKLDEKRNKNTRKK